METPGTSPPILALHNPDFSRRFHCFVRQFRHFLLLKTQLQRTRLERWTGIFELISHLGHLASWVWNARVRVLTLLSRERNSYGTSEHSHQPFSFMTSMVATSHQGVVYQKRELPTGTSILRFLLEVASSGWAMALLVTVCEGDVTQVV